MSRLVLRPFTFSNSVTVPAGTEVAFSSSTTHRDERVFTNPDVFDGFRFAKLRESEGDETNNRYQTVSTSHEQLSFGVGRHAWYAFLIYDFDLTRHRSLTVLDDSLRSMKSRRCWPISSLLMISSLRKGKVHRRPFPLCGAFSRECECDVQSTAEVNRSFRTKLERSLYGAE